MNITSLDRRRYRRARLELPVVIRGLGQEWAVGTGQVQTTDLSLAGLHCSIGRSEQFAQLQELMRLNQNVTVSITVPYDVRDLFPFSRLIGRGRVVRVDEAGGDASQLVGVGIEFAEDFKVLTATPYSR